jgi:G:T-mismatch repair DNA endonuclease (very short patch repair protein)
MTDILTLARRSALMAKVRGTGDASTELRLLAVVRALGVTGLAAGSAGACRRVHES